MSPVSLPATSHSHSHSHFHSYPNAGNGGETHPDVKILIIGAGLVDRGLGDHVFVVGVTVTRGFDARGADVGCAAALFPGEGER